MIAQINFHKQLKLLLFNFSSKMLSFSLKLQDTSDNEITSSLFELFPFPILEIKQTSFILNHNKSNRKFFCFLFVILFFILLFEQVLPFHKLGIDCLYLFWHFKSYGVSILYKSNKLCNLCEYHLISFYLL